MYIHLIYVCMYVYMYVCMCMYICMYVCVYVYMYVYMYVCEYMCMLYWSISWRKLLYWWSYRADLTRLDFERTHPGFVTAYISSEKEWKMVTAIELHHLNKYLANPFIMYRACNNSCIPYVRLWFGILVTGLSASLSMQERRVTCCLAISSAHVQFPAWKASKLWNLI